MSAPTNKSGCLGSLLALIVGLAIGTYFGWPKSDKEKDIPPPITNTWKDALSDAAKSIDLALLLQRWENLDSSEMENFLRNIDTLPANSSFWEELWKLYQTDVFLHAALLDAWHSKAPDTAEIFAAEFVTGTAKHGAATTFGTALWYAQKFPDKITKGANATWLVGIVEVSPMLALRLGADIPQAPAPPLPRSFFHSGPFSEPEKALPLIDALPEPLNKNLAADLFIWWAENKPEDAWKTFKDRHALTVSAALQKIASTSPTKAAKFAGRLPETEAGGHILAALAGMEASGMAGEADKFANILTITQISQIRAFWESRDYDRIPRSIAPRIIADSANSPLSPALLKAIILPTLDESSLTPLAQLAVSNENLNAGDARLAVLAMAQKGVDKLWEAIASLPDSPLKTTLATEAASQSARAAPNQALDIIRNQSSDTLRKTALPVFIAEAPVSLRDTITSNVWPGITDTDLSNRIAYSISRWQPDAPSQAAWLLQNSPDVLSWPTLQQQLGQQWFASDPEGFVEWVKSIKETRIRDGFLGFVIASIADTETEKAEQLASDLLLRDEGLNDLALAALGKAKLKSDPVGGLAWTERIADQTARRAAMTQLVPLLKELSASVQASALTNAPISEDTLTFLKSALSQ